MSDNKFFIGLGATVPSTRILKPPGGDCSDLFGLNTRQKEQIKPLKGTSNVIDYLLRKEQPDVRHLKKPDRRSISLPVVTSKNRPFVMPSSGLPSPSGSVNFLNALQSPTDSVASLLACTGSNSAKEPTGFDINSVGDNFSGLKIKDQRGMSVRESLKSSRESSELSHLDKAKYGNLEQRASSMSLNSSVSTKNGNSMSNTCTSGKTSAESEMHMNQEPETQFIRNPITGALTEYKSWNKSNPVISRMMSIQEGKNNVYNSEMSKNTRITSDEASLKATRNAFPAKRNPITGEGMPLNPYLSKHTKIRVIHPPGGTSSGIY